MKHRLLIVGILLCLWVVVGTVPAGAAEPVSVIAGTLTHDNVERSYLLHLPPDYDPAADDAIPVIVALHGGASSAWAMMAETGLNDAADAAGQMVVYPFALGYDWGLNADPTDEDQSEDDVGFIGALIDQLAADYNADPAQVYLVGYQDGGLMAYKLACVTPERFESVAVVGPLLWEHIAESCPAAADTPVNLLIVHGTDDPLYTRDTHLFDVIFYEMEYTVWGVQDTLDFWIERNQCDSAVMTSVNGVMNARAYTACDNDTQVALYSVIGGRENWPRMGAYALNSFGLDVAAMVIRFFAGETETWAVEQPPFEAQARTYALYVPSTYDPAEPMPVVMTLHGRFGSGESTAEWTDMNRIAEENGFIAVYPDGLTLPESVWYDTGWNYQRGAYYSDQDHPDDGLFLANLLDDLALDLAIDSSRVYVAGISNGGYMVHHLACHDPQRYAAFADVIGSGYLGMERQCQVDTPVPMLLMHGTDDDNVLMDGSTVEVEGELIYTSYPVAGVFHFWGVHNGCETEDFTATELPQLGQSPNSSVVVLAYECPDGVETQLYGIIGGGHNWPGTADSVEEAIENKINMDINAGEELWTFFSRQQRRN